MSSCYRIIRSQGDVKIKRGMDDNDIKSKAVEIGNADDVCACDSEEDGVNYPPPKGGGLVTDQ